MDFALADSGIAFLFEYLIKSSVILSVSILLVSLLRKKSASLRHLILSAFLIGLLFLPILSSFKTGWETRFLPSLQTRKTVSLGTEGLTGNLNRTSKTFVSSQVNPGDSIPVEEIKSDSPSILSSFLSRVKLVVGFGVLSIWILGSLSLLVRIVIGLLGTYRFAREGQHIQDSLWRRLLYRFLKAVSLRRKVNLMSHDKTMVPFIWGVIRPVVMMPVKAVSWSEDQRSTALYHELSHVKRGDYLVMILARITRAVYWFNPLSWIVLGMIKREQEKACDELVLKAGIKPSTYAENLLFIRKSVSGHWNPPAAVLGAVNRSHLNDRLTTILKQRFNLEEVQMKTKVLLSFLAILSISFIGLARPGNSASCHDEALSSANPQAVASVDAQDVQGYPQDQEKKEKKEIKKGVKVQDEDKDKEREHKKTTVVLTTEEGKKGTYKIIIDKDNPENFVCVASPHIKIEKGKYATWTINAHKLYISDDAKKVSLKDGSVVYLDKECKDGFNVIKLDSPHVLVKKVGEDPEHVTVGVHVSTSVELHPEAYTVIDSEEYEELIKTIKEKLAKLKAQRLDSEEKKKEFEAVEKSLEELQKAFEKKHRKSEHVSVKVKDTGSHLFTIKTKGIPLDHEEGYCAVNIIHDEGILALIYHAKIDTDQKEAYDKAVKNLESKLPEGYNVESTFDADEGTFEIKISKEKEAVDSIDTIKKLIKEFQEKLKTTRI